MPAAEGAARRAPIAWSLATVLGVGHFPVASGTAATVLAIPLWLAAHAAGGHALVLVLAVALSLLGALAAGIMEDRLGYHDPSEVVIDEVAGFFTTMLFVPPGLVACLAGFLIFRALDVLKPWPASAAEKLPRGWGIMADDIVCGLIGCGVLHLGMLLWR